MSFGQVLSSARVKKSEHETGYDNLQCTSKQVKGTPVEVKKL